MNTLPHSDAGQTQETSSASISSRNAPARSSNSPSSSNSAGVKQTMRDVRLQKHVDYQRAYAASRKKQSASMSWFLAPQTSLQGHGIEPIGPRVGLTVGKVIGKAHERNRIKRRMREALRRHVDLLPASCDLILHPRRVVLTAEFAKLEAEIVRILKQAQADAARSEQNQPPQGAAAMPV